MEVTIHGIPASATNRQLKEFFGPLLLQSHIGIFDIEAKRRSIPEYWLNDNGERIQAMRVVITTAKERHAGAFAQMHGGNLWWTNIRLQVSDLTTNGDPLLLRAMKYMAAKHPNLPRDDDDDIEVFVPTRFGVTTLHCGDWAYKDDPADRKLTFVPYFSDVRGGEIIFGQAKAMIMLGHPKDERIRIDVVYKNCKDIVLGNSNEPEITFNLASAPKIFLAAPNLNANHTRLGTINQNHARIASSCFVYRIRLTEATLFDTMQESLRLKVRDNLLLSLDVPTCRANESWSQSLVHLEREMLHNTNFGEQAFKVCFQLMRLALNGILPPRQVATLIPHVNHLLGKHKANNVLLAINKMSRILKVRGPHSKAEEVDTAAQIANLDALVAAYNRCPLGNPYEISARLRDFTLVHTVIITPAGVSYQGPVECYSNHVLRRYEGQLDKIIRVKFQDDDGGSINFDTSSNLKALHDMRFKSLLRNGFAILGHPFRFLGYASSALRHHTCWMVADMVINGAFVGADQILRELGDFSDIRSPGRCAARIGQNLTDTNATVDVAEDMIRRVPDVEHHGYTFSDGCGSISMALLERVWEHYGNDETNPTVLQIRFKGVRGMIALDSRLEGECLVIRPSMEKFHTDTTSNLQICGAANKTLPMYLNGPLIQVLSDLGVPDAVFEDYQEQTVSKLRQVQQSTSNAERLLPLFTMCNAGQFSSLVRRLEEVGLDYRRDQFLLGAVDLSTLNGLLDIKYRNRIHVDKGATLYGIMDETGVLAAGEIYVAMDSRKLDGQQALIRDRVGICRSPVKHPGDIQVVRAVQVPEASPLRRLSHVIVFSQHGERDLPSQLGGGDLDGDQFQVFWDEKLVPPKTHPAAAYAHEEGVSLDRAVTRADITDFFVDFMSADVISAISKRHLQYVDQAPTGSLDPNSIRIAEMASTAVDAGKTGNFVKMRQVPSSHRCRPDFTEPRPELVISDDGLVQLERPETYVNDVAFADIVKERDTPLYYPSEKILGKLFRAIEDFDFLENAVPGHSRTQTRHPSARSVMTKLLYLMQVTASGQGLLYKEHLEAATAIRASYEESLAKMLYHLAPTPDRPLKEVEAFAGMVTASSTIVSGSELRELSKAAREHLQVLVDYTVLRLQRGVTTDEHVNNYPDDTDQTSWPSLQRAIASLFITVHHDQRYKDPKLGHLISFRYIAAHVCLQELENFVRAKFGPNASLPILPPYMLDMP